MPFHYAPWDRRGGPSGAAVRSDDYRGEMLRILLIIVVLVIIAVIAMRMKNGNRP